jgi:hypothetical protein
MKTMLSVKSVSLAESIPDSASAENEPATADRFVAIRAMLTAIALAVLASGCATITGNEMQSLTLSTRTTDGQPVYKVQCSLKNDKGEWKAESPGTIGVRRSAEDLMVECTKPGTPDGFLRAVSRAHGGMFGNIIFGGGIGAIIDHNKGTGYDYPNDLPVKMGASTTVDKREEQPRANAQDPPQPSK